jgi:hypothetical protein
MKSSAHVFVSTLTERLSMPQMEIIFDWDGETVHKKTKGFSGGDCVSKTDFIEKALGTTGKRTYTEEYYGQPNQQEDRLRN